MQLGQALMKLGGASMVLGGATADENGDCEDGESPKPYFVHVFLP